MILLILAVIIGIGMGLFATQNAVVVPLSLAGTTFTHVPLYLVALFSLLGGLLLSGIFHVVDGISSQLALNGKDRELKKTESTINQLSTRVRELEDENAQLRSEKTVETHGAIDEPSTIEHHESVSERMRRLFHTPEPSV